MNLVADWSSVPVTEARPGLLQRGFGTPDVLLLLNEFGAGFVPGTHHHDDFDQLVVVLEGTGHYRVGDVDHPVGPGSLLLIERGVSHGTKPAPATTMRTLEVFAPSRADYAHLVAWMDEDERVRPPAACPPAPG